MLIWVCGAKGLLGQDLVELLKRQKCPFVASGHAEVDITKEEELEMFYERYHPTHVINCTAYVQVDLAEEEEAKAHLVNVEGVKNLAHLAKKHKMHLIHISTDYVFDGEKKGPYREEEATRGVNVYGKTKLEGEKALFSILPTALSIRTASLYGGGKEGLITGILKLLQSQEEVFQITDQMSTPTYTKDLAEGIWPLLNESGIYHFVNKGHASRFELAEEVKRLAIEYRIPILATTIHPILQHQVHRKAVRPKYSVLSTEKYEKKTKRNIRSWQEALRDYFEEHIVWQGKVVLVTGGAGFMGSDFIRHLLLRRNFKGKIINLDLLTYAGNLDNLASIANDPRYHFIKGDICDSALLETLFTEFSVDVVVHFAAESHVDRSIDQPRNFLETNIIGTYTLLERIRRHPNIRFHHISTDEVYGDLSTSEGYFTERSQYAPSSPYSASKASSDHLVKAYARTYGIFATISHASNNFGPGQHTEKLIPRMIERALTGETFTVYGSGLQVRDWLYVEDHSEGVYQILLKGKEGEVYNLGGNQEKTNLEVIDDVIRLVAKIREEDPEIYRKRIVHVADRPGHDFRYAMDITKIKTEIGWWPKVRFEEGLEKMIREVLCHAESPV